jgi:hypothetical protein
LLAFAVISSCPAAAQTPVAAPAKEAEPGEPRKEQKAEASGDTEFRNWVEVSAGGTLVGGNPAAFQRRAGIRQGAFGGIEDFHWETDAGKDGLLKLDGRGLFDLHDYSVKLDLTLPEKGFVRGGYKEFRTYYDGSGGFYPGAGATPWLEPFDDDLHVDHREAWFEGGLRLPNWPEFTVRYSHQERDGRKDSTAWGSASPAVPNRYVPAFWNLDEVRDIIQADLKHTIRSTAVGLGLRYEHQDLGNGLYLSRSPGQPADHIAQQNDADADIFNFHAFTETWIKEKALLTTGYAYTDLDSDLYGYRRYGGTYDADLLPRLSEADAFENLAGGADLRQHVVNLNLMLNLRDNLAFVPSVRVEKQDVESESSYDRAGGRVAAESDRGLLDVSERLELRYTGITNWVFYARGDWLQGRGDLEEALVGEPILTLNNFARSTDDERFGQKYTAGLKWYPLRRLHFSAEYYHKTRNNEFDHERDSTPNFVPGGNTYPAFLRAQDYETDDLNGRVTWRILRNLTLVGRYDFQKSTVNTQPDGLKTLETAEITSHIFGGSVSWTPLSRLYVQGSFNYVLDETETPADEWTGPSAGLATNFESDYYNGSVTVGYALSDRTDLEAQGLLYRADNYEGGASVSQPYGSTMEEYGLTAGLVHRLSPRMRVSLKYGYFTSHDRTSGGHNDYDAHLVYSSLQYRF